MLSWIWYASLSIFSREFLRVYSILKLIRCVDRIQEVNQKIEDDLAADPSTIKKTFNASELNDIEFLSMIADIYAGMV